MTRRPTRFALCASLLLALGSLVGAPPAAADPPPPVTYQWDVAELHPGDTANLDITFTNPHQDDVVFVYMSLNTHYDMIVAGPRWDWLGCTGDAAANDCPTHPYVPIAPGDSRTMTVSIRIEDDSPCGEPITVHFFSYIYWESAAGYFQGIDEPSVLRVLC